MYILFIPDARIYVVHLPKKKKIEETTYIGSRYKPGVVIEKKKKMQRAIHTTYYAYCTNILS